jgi:hypothetical protein
MAEALAPLVVDAARADGEGGFHVVPRGRRGGRWLRVEAAEALDVLGRAGPAAVVLAPEPAVDPGAAPLLGLARLAGNPVVLLPARPADAGWVVALARAWARGGETALVRRIEAAAGLAARCGAGGEGDGLGWRALGRLAASSWRPCRWCTGGGGAGAWCARCGAGAVAR